MILLPRGNPVKEKIDPGKINLPDSLRKLRDGRFTGYLRFDAADATGIVIFEQGRLISALCEEKGGRAIAYDAISRIFNLSLGGGANLDVFRLSSDLALSIHALLHGHLLYRGQEIKLIDIKALLGQMKEEKVSGCLRIYTDEHIALIFYRQGTPLGFFHDGSTDLETTADTSMSVARLPGAKIDVLTTTADEELILADLMASVDVATLWNREIETINSQRRKLQEVETLSQAMVEKARREKVLTVLRAAAEKGAGKIGISLVEKEFDRLGEVDETALEGLYAVVAKGAKLVAGPSRVEAMIDEMRRSARAALKN